MGFQRTSNNFIQGLAYSVALHQFDNELTTLARKTLWRLSFYQPVSNLLLTEHTLRGRFVDKAYSLLGRCIPDPYLKEGRELVMLKVRQPATA